VWTRNLSTGRSKKMLGMLSFFFTAILHGNTPGGRKRKRKAQHEEEVSKKALLRGVLVIPSGPKKPKEIQALPKGWHDGGRGRIHISSYGSDLDLGRQGTE